RANALAGTVTRADFAADLYVEDARLSMSALGTRLSLKGFVQELDRPNSKRWASGGGRSPRVVRLYDKGEEMKKPGLNIVRLEVSWNESKYVQRHLGKGLCVTLDDILEEAIGIEAFLQLIAPALPDAIALSDGYAHGFESLYERAGKNRGLAREAMAQVFEDIYMGKNARLRAIYPYSRSA